ncbi:MAG: hypothetical protein FJX71_04470 [Alphaproteobacteria bacterium]|nr:hypothetical protein [Alphaproteobacteria bacterium]
MSQKYLKIIIGTVLAFLIYLNSNAIERPNVESKANQESRESISPKLLHAQTLSKVMIDLKIPFSVSQDAFKKIYTLTDDIVTLFERSPSLPIGLYSSAWQAVESLKEMKKEDAETLMEDRLREIKDEIIFLSSFLTKLSSPTLSLAPDLDVGYRLEEEHEPEKGEKNLKVEPGLKVPGADLTGYPFVLFDGNETEDNKEYYKALRDFQGDAHPSRVQYKILVYGKKEAGNKFTLAIRAHDLTQGNERTVLWFPEHENLDFRDINSRLAICSFFLSNTLLFGLYHLDPLEPIRILSSNRFSYDDQAKEVFRVARERLRIEHQEREARKAARKAARGDYEALIDLPGSELTGYPFALFNGDETEDNKEYYKALRDFQADTHPSRVQYTILVHGKKETGNKFTLAIRAHDLNHGKETTVLWIPEHENLHRRDIFSRSVNCTFFLSNALLFGIYNFDQLEPVRILSSSGFAYTEEAKRIFQMAREIVFPVL